MSRTPLILVRCGSHRAADFAFPGIHMINNNATPLEHLAAFAIVFVTGVLSTAILGRYIEAVRRDAAKDACARND